MSNFIKNRLRSFLLESMPDEDVGMIKINIPFDKLVLDAENTKIAIRNIKGNKPSRSKDKPMQIAIGDNGKYYLLDGYHRFVEAVSEGKKQTIGIGLNKSFEELKKLNKIGVACAGGSGDEFCNNFKTTLTFKDVKQAFQKQVAENEWDICDDFSINSMEELITHLNNTDDIKPHQKQEIYKLLDGVKQSNAELSNDLDNLNTVAHKISTILCGDKDNLD
jgi:hypothetical protein